MVTDLSHVQWLAKTKINKRLWLARRVSESSVSAFFSFAPIPSVTTLHKLAANKKKFKTQDIIYFYCNIRLSREELNKKSRKTILFHNTCTVKHLFLQGSIFCRRIPYKIPRDPIFAAGAFFHYNDTIWQFFTDLIFADFQKSAKKCFLQYTLFHSFLDYNRVSV